MSENTTGDPPPREGETLKEWLQKWIDRISARVAKWLAPLMPWFYVALARALIPTLVGLLVGILFLLVPQSREVLHGLSEPMLKSFAEFDSDDRSAINAMSLAFYVGTAVLLGLSIWYGARLLAGWGGSGGVPSALQKSKGAQRLMYASVWYPRCLGVAALAAAIGALIYANYTPRLSQGAAFALAVAAVAAPLAALAGHLRAGLQPPRPFARWLKLLGVALGVVMAVLLWRLHAKWPMAAWSIASSMLPALLLLFLVRRRRRSADESTVARHGVALQFGDVIYHLVALAVLAGAVVASLALLPPAWIRAYGSAATALLFVASVALSLTAVQLVLRRFADNVPGLTTVVIAALTALTLLVGDEGLGRETLPLPATAMGAAVAAPAAGAAVPAAAASAPVPRALYVNAHGGGLRAAVFTAQVLARADDATCGAFGEQVAAFSGVSGGSVGIATYLLARQTLVARGGWGDCHRDAPDKPRRTPLADIVTNVLVQDHLSPAIGRMVAWDTLSLPPIRGGALLDSWNDALTSALAAHFKGTQPHDYAGFALPLARLSGGFAVAPLVYFNATDADSGHIVWFSNARGGVAGTHGQQERPLDIAVGQAVLHSARFPIVTPAGAFDPPWAPGKTLRLIDGGYVDNSGTTTLLDVLTSGTPPHTEGAQPRMINIDGNPSAETECRKAGGPSPILTAVGGLLQARSAHAARAVERLENHINAPRIDAKLDLEAAFADEKTTGAALCAKVARAQPAPLGWYMSYEAAAMVARSAEFGVRSICASLALACRAAPVAVPRQD
jgi:uncharacterized membrane protein